MTGVSDDRALSLEGTGPLYAWVGLEPRFDQIPEKLKALPQWVLWAAVAAEGGRVSKVPKTPLSKNASVADPDTWSDFATVAASYDEGGFSGVGFVLSVADSFFGGDFDHCRDPDTEIINPDVAQAIESFDTYAEVSPSGTGVRLIGIGNIPTGRQKGTRLELYESKRFLTITGHRLNHAEINSVNADLLSTTRDNFIPQQKTNGTGQPQSINLGTIPSPMADERIEAYREKDERFRKAWDHNRPDLTDQSLSGYDMALVNWAVSAELDDNDAWALIRAHRIKYGDGEKALRRDYVARTVGEARRFVQPDNDDATDKAVKRLAQLPDIRYDQVREEEAKKLKVRVATLDAARKKAREPESAGRGRALFTDSLEPWPEPVNGAELAAEIETRLTGYMDLPENTATALSLWILLTYCFNSFDVCPLVAITSPTKRCGKTRLLSLLQDMVNKPLPASSISPAALFRAVEEWEPTLLIDEADTFLKEDEALRGLLNSGFTRTAAYAVRTVEIRGNHEPRAFSTWCPKILALIGNPPDTIVDRSLLVPMQRKTAAKKLPRLRDIKDKDALRRRCLRWAIDTDLSNANPILFDSENDRALDIWEPLLAIAEAVGDTWPERARQAAAALSAVSETDEAALKLLRDIRAGFAGIDGPDFLKTETLLDKLHQIEDSPWQTWGRSNGLTGHALARLLQPFGLKPKQYRHGKERGRGYSRAALEAVWERYL